jgi:hypothetical protein
MTPVGLRVVRLVNLLMVTRDSMANAVTLMDRLSLLLRMTPSSRGVAPSLGHHGTTPE